jgi:hypothetical protein
MTAPWMFQLRIHFAGPVAAIARGDPANPVLRPLQDVLARHGASMKCVLDAFQEYVDEAEARGVEHYPLYRWTRDTVEDPAKRKRHLEVFTVQVGGEEVYPEALADPLESDLLALVDGTLIERIARYDTNPANNPQPPAR